jgi:hypothetical protein
MKDSNLRQSVAALHDAIPSLKQRRALDRLANDIYEAVDDWCHFARGWTTRSVRGGSPNFRPEFAAQIDARKQVQRRRLIERIVQSRIGKVEPLSQIGPSIRSRSTMGWLFGPFGS